MQFSASTQSDSGNEPRAGEDLEEVIVHDPAFKDVASATDDRLRVSKPWPADGLPPVTASLMSIASQKGLLAVGGPDSLGVVSTEKARVRYLKRRKKADASEGRHEDEGPIQPLEPDVTLSLPRISHVAFSSDESCLVVAAEQGGGLAVYDTSSLSRNSQPAFQVATMGTSVRHLLPNPSAGEDTAHLFGVVLTDGKLVLADLKARCLVNNQHGSPVFCENVSSAAWSKLGKQIIAGLADSTATQIDPKGNVKDRIPPPPQLKDLEQQYEGISGLPVTSISWLTTYEFLLIYTPIYPSAEVAENGNQDSLYFHAIRQKSQPFTFHKLDIDPCTPFGMTERTPAQHFIARLGDWQNIKDLLLISSTASTDIGLFGRFKDSKSQNLVTVTIDESRQGKAALPVNSETDADTSTIGMAVDFSTKEVAPEPIPNQGDLYRHSGIPLPVLYILNNDGILLMWWFVYADAIKNNAMYAGMVHRGGRYAKYKKYNKLAIEMDPNNPHHTVEEESDDETEPRDGATPPTTQPSSSLGAVSSQSKSPPIAATPPQPQPTPFGQSNFGQPAAKPAFEQSSTPGFGAAGGLGQKPSLWGSSPSSGSPAPAFGQTSSAGGPSAFGRPSAPGTGFSFGKPSNLGDGSAFGQPSQPGVFGQPSKPGSTLGQLGHEGQNKPSPFSSAPATQSPFGKFASNTSPFANAGQPNSASPFASAGKGQPSIFGSKSSLSKENSTASTATIGSSEVSSFGKPSPFGVSSFASRPTLSKESTMQDDALKAPEPNTGGNGLFGLSGGFKLGSGFTGDGTAKDDLPKPANPGAGLFGAGFGDALSSTASKKAEPAIKKEPGSDQQPSLKDIPAAKPDEAPLPPDPSTYKAPKMPDISTLPGFGPSHDAPLPPDPMTHKAPKMPDISTLPGFASLAKKQEEKDEPIAGSPPLNVTRSQTFSSNEGSEVAGPSEEDDGEWGDQGEEGEVDEEDEEESEESYEEDDGDEEEPSHARTPQSDEKTIHSSYTPAGLPKGPVFAPPSTQTGQSPRSPSPQRRAVTSPMKFHLPSQIKTSAVPPAKLVEKPKAPPQPREPTAGELEDQAYTRVEALLNAPIEPTKDLPTFYTHTDYTGSIDKPGLGGQIEKVFRDVNSMIHVVGLNARSLNSFLTGQQELRIAGKRSLIDLEDPRGWCLGDMQDLDGVLESLSRQLESGRLEHVREILADVAEEQKEVSRIKAKAVEVRKHVTAHTDPRHVAAREAAPLSAEMDAQQSELRRNVQKVQTLLSEVEQKMTMLRADIASASSSKANGQAPVPTVEAVTNTILRMTAMAQQRSGDIDVLEAKIKRLPNGIASLRLDDDYEDDLASRLAGNRLLAASTSGTPQRRPRMAANGDALGMSAMFGASRFQTPPSGRRSTRFTPDASGFGRSTGSFGGSARKKMYDVTDEEVDAFRVKAQRRKAVLDALKGRVEQSGARVVRVE